MVIFERLAQLLMPADGTLRARSVEAPLSWSLPAGSLHGLDAAVWGRPPLPSGTARFFAARAAVARERSLMRLRRNTGAGLRAVAVHRWFPPDLGSAGARRRVKNALLGGALIELSGAEFARVLDAAASAAGYPRRVGGFQCSSGGAVRITKGARPQELLRVGATETSADPARAAAALTALEGAGIGAVPRLVRKGGDSRASWSVETFLPGATPRRLHPALLVEIASLCAELPSGSGPAAAFEEDVGEICRHLPAVAERVHEFCELARRACAELPGITRHGDLWTGNLLVDGSGEVSGVLDWDAWHPAGVPGCDLLHLYAFDGVRRAATSLGMRWAQRPWFDPGFAATTEHYWQRVGVRPSRVTLEAVGVAWWANQVAQSLRRLPHLAAHVPWVEANVGAVLAATS